MKKRKRKKKKRLRMQHRDYGQLPVAIDVAMAY
jgi:hypothetical protein